MSLSLKPVFLDTAYVYALLNTRDQWHQTAVLWQRKLAQARRRLVTTEFILMEVGDGLATLRFRTHTSKIIAALRTSPLVEVVSASSDLFNTALDLYDTRPDKDWGLTDCASFVVMRERDLTEALTTDGHFQQAGFSALLLEGNGTDG